MAAPQKFNEPVGRMPTLQFCRPAELRIDPAYQRSLETVASKKLVQRIAREWNWDLCQPLVAARRVDLTERLFVIDGQHRLAAARLRGDIGQLPCVIVTHASVADEAAAFVKLNQQRQPLSGLDLFKAAVASGDGEAVAIVGAVEAAGLAIAPHSNPYCWKPGQVSNIGGIRQVWRRFGEAVTAAALRVLAQAFGGQVLQYAGTIFPGIAAVCFDEIAARGRFGEARFEKFIALLGRSRQADWRADMLRARADNPGLQFAQASERVIRTAWARADEQAAPVFRPAGPLPPQPGTAARVGLQAHHGTKWCEQCEDRVSHAAALTCKSRWCSLRKPG